MGRSVTFAAYMAAISVVLAPVRGPIALPPLIRIGS